MFVDVYPSKANQEIEWTITPAGSVSISDNGQITALAGGLVTIRATAKDGSGIYDEKTFRVFNDATDFEIQGAEVMSPGTTQTLLVKLLVDYCQSTFKWESSNPEVATINENGLVTAVADGTVTITATADDSTGISKTFTISVSGIKITIGDAEYPSFEDALEAAKEGDVIVLDQGTYKDNYTIAVNGLTITSEDKEKTIITGTITLAKDVANTKFEKLTFQGSGKLTSEAEGGQDGITVDNCIFDSCTNDGFIRLEGPAKNLVFTNNLVINNKSARGVRAEKTLEGFIATDNEFYDGGGTYDWLRTQGAISGEVVIERNIAIGSSQSFIMFMYHGSGNFTIKDNEIYDMDCVAIDIRTSNGVACTSTFNIIHNLMNNSNVDPSGVWNPVRLRFNDYTQETLEVNVNYNIYINWMDSKEANQFIEDASNCTLGWINADNNYFDGYTAEKLSDKLFDNIASSYLNPFTDVDELEKAYQAYLLTLLSSNYDFVNNFADYAKDWNSSYTERVITSEQLGDGYFNGKFTISNGSKQSSTITDCPVIAAKNNTVYVTVEADFSSFSGVTFKLKKWSDSKVFTNIHIEFSTDGTTWTTCSEVVTAVGDISTNASIAEAKYVRLSITTTNSKNQQLGLTGVEFTK